MEGNYALPSSIISSLRVVSGRRRDSYALQCGIRKEVQAMLSLLLTDLYELTMAYGYWKKGMHEREAAFHLIFRKNPFQGGYTVACGLVDAIAYIQAFSLHEEEA